MTAPADPATISGVPTPAIIVDLDAFNANIAAAAAMMQGTGKRLRPHVKTHKTPGLARRQLGASATGVTCATVGEAEVMAQAGITDIFVANEIVTPGKAERLAHVARSAQVAVAVDSRPGIEVIASAARAAGTVIRVLVDVDVGLGRCGARSPDDAVALGRTVTALPQLRLVGLMGYEGRLRASNPDRQQRAERASRTLAAACAAFASAGLPCDVVSSAGTSTMLQATASPHITEIQAGTYALMEADLAGLNLPFAPAVTVAATVISRSGDRAVLDVGKKAISCDYGPPGPLTKHAQLTAINEEHTVLQYDQPAPDLGTQVVLRPHHVRLTFNLHDHVWLTSGNDVVDRLPVTARGHSS
jgi:D-serine deaminase-like pyridoxal phosphate-dependent protein